MAEKKHVFVSYSWGVEGDTGIVKALQLLCEERGIALQLDKEVLEHGASIRQFMEEQAGSEHILLILSRKYFESRWCMYELMRTYQNTHFRRSVQALIADDCPVLSDDNYHGIIKTHWQCQLAEAKKRWPTGSQEFRHLRLYEQLDVHADELLGFVADMNILPLVELQQQKYAQILDKIQPRVGTVALFKEEIITNIQQELSEKSVAIFVDELCKELNKILPGFAFPEEPLQAGEVNRIAKTLVWLVENGGDEVPAIQKGLKNAYMNCFHRKGKRRNDAEPYKEQITEAVEQILGWLVLAAINENQLSQLLPAADFSRGVHFQIPVETRGGVELIVSRCSERSANIEAADTEVEARHLTCVNTKDFSWKEPDTIDTLIRMIWNKVFPELSQESSLTLSPVQVKRLDAEIALRRRDDWEREHHYLAIQGELLKGNKHYESVCAALLKKLPNLTLVNFGVAGEQSVFYMLEHHLIQVINNFLSSINKV